MLALVVVVLGLFVLLRVAVLLKFHSLDPFADLELFTTVHPFLAARVVQTARGERVAPGVTALQSAQDARSVADVEKLAPARIPVQLVHLERRRHFVRRLTGDVAVPAHDVQEELEYVRPQRRAVLVCSEGGRADV